MARGAQGAWQLAALSARFKLKNVIDREQWKITENRTKAAAAATKQGRQWRGEKDSKEINGERVGERGRGEGSEDTMQLEPGKVRRPRTHSRQVAARLDSDNSDRGRGRRRRRDGGIGRERERHREGKGNIERAREGAR